MQQEGKKIIQKIQHTGLKIQQLKMKMKESVDRNQEEEEIEKLYNSL